MYESLKPFGLLSVVIGCVAVLFLVINWRGDKTMSISKHASAHRGAYLTMAITSSIFLPMYFVFITTWFAHTFQLPFIFDILNGVIVIGLLIAAWMPDETGIHHKIHHWACYPAYSSMVLMILMLTVYKSVGSFARVYCLVALLALMISGIYLVKNNGSKILLYVQGLFLALVYSSILVATYIR